MWMTFKTKLFIQQSKANLDMKLFFGKIKLLSRQVSQKKFTRLAGCDTKSIRPIFKTKMKI